MDKTVAMVILQECIDIMEKKAADYQNSASTVKQADYYLNGIQTIYDVMHGKMLRIKSILETMQNDPKFKPNHESLRDSFMDLINYSAFGAAYLEGGIPGQDKTKDIFNKIVCEKIEEDYVEKIRPSQRNIDPPKGWLGTKSLDGYNG